jgi:hypothetical protein
MYGVIDMNLRQMVDLQTVPGDLTRLKTMQTGGPGSGRKPGSGFSDILKKEGVQPGYKGQGYICKNCGGSGSKTKGKKDCRVCGGSGLVTKSRRNIVEE